jgi:HPt (histidine-containing phosphotransfer) domain-containing protein
MIDKDTFRSVFADFDAEIINQIISIYKNEHPIKFRDIEASFQNRDFNNLRSIAHGLKGVLSQFFASEAQQQAKDLEFFARELAEYYSNKPGVDLEDEHKMRLENLIETLRNSSLVVIQDLQEIKAEYN